MTATVAARLRELSTGHGDAVVSVDLDGVEQRLSWPQVADGAGRIAAGLRDADPGAERPAVVAVRATNTAAALVRLLGVLAADLPVLPLDPRMPDRERQRLLEFVAREYGPVHVLSGRSDGDDEPVAVVERVPGPDRGDERRPVAYLLATGGSSGLPKVVAAPGPLRYDPARVPSPLLRHAGWRTGQRQLIAGPLHHTGPFTSCLDGVLDRNVIVLLPVFTPELLVEQIREQRIEWLQLTPSHLRTVLRFAEPDPASFATVRAVLHTAAACDLATKQAWLDLLGPQRVFEAYGSTEQVGVTLVRGDEWLARPGTVGRGFMTQIRILDDAGRRLPPGEVGAVYLRAGRAGRPSYLGGLPMARTPDGFVSVGDHGWLDQDGYLFLAPRRTDLINVGGENVYPAEVEAALLEHPSVLDAMVVGGPDPVFGAVVHARVVRAAGARPSGPELMRHCAARLAPYKVPNKISFVASVPRSAAGKLERWRSAAQEDG
ncbi:MAG TPA: AMP-binding protein [Micromonosporaceae bacterium]|nr:AMP-binding protein [Micromonosporaceae bacterium]